MYVLADILFIRCNACHASVMLAQSLAQQVRLHYELRTDMLGQKLGGVA